MRDLISKRTRNEFRETLVGWVLREIEIEFDNEGFLPDLSFNPAVSGARRSYVEQYYARIDFRDIAQVERLVRVYESIISQIRAHNSTLADKLIGLLERDSFRYENGQFVYIGQLSGIQPVRRIADRLDADEMLKQIRRMESSVETDPALAIGSAKELVESCCKTILNDRAALILGQADLPQLLKATLKELQLAPDNIPNSARGADAIRKMLRSLGVVVDGMAEVRNLYGSGHGKDGRTRGLTPRHARLAVGAATVLSTFLFETHDARANEGICPPAPRSQ
jgi:Abortive infection C-terminus